jgi:hypothetical protein
VAIQRLPIDQAAVQLGCSISTLRPRIKNGEVRAVRDRHAGGFTYLVEVEADQPEFVHPALAEVDQLRRERDDANARADRLLSLLEQTQARADLLTHQLVQLTSPRHETPAHSPPSDYAAAEPADQATRLNWWKRLWARP